MNLSFLGKPPQCDAWIGQCGLYILIMVLEKIAIALLVMLEFWHDVRRFILKPIRKYPKVEVALVMLIIPFIINVSLEFFLNSSSKPFVRGFIFSFPGNLDTDNNSLL